jgi:putative multiple sugar transport system substrate-binding protein
MKKIISVAVAVCLSAFLLMSCSKKTSDTIGVSMPTQSLERWNFDGNNLKSELEKKGYNVSLQFANNDVPTQVNQIQNLITAKVKVLIIAAIDGAALIPVLQQAKDQGIKVIAYDRLIMGSPNVDYYVTFDNFQVGVLEGKILEKGLGLDGGAKGPFYIEVFAGAPDDNNARYFYDGAWSVIKPYVDKGIVKIPSNQYGWPKYGTESWSTQKAMERMTNLLSKYYSAANSKLDAVLSPNDSVAYGIIQALKGAGYAVGDEKKSFPIISGQDCDRVNVKAIWDGEQTASVFKNTRTLALRAVAMTEAILEGKEPAVNDSETYNNGSRVVPSYLETPVTVYKDDIKKELIDSGYYKWDDVQIKP